MWSVEFDPAYSLLTLRVSERVGAPQLRALMRAHGRAIEAAGTGGFASLHDLRGMAPLDTETAEAFALARRAELSAGCFRRVVVASSPTIALQQRRVSAEDPVAASVDELVTMEHEAAISFLEGLAERL